MVPLVSGKWYFRNARLRPSFISRPLQVKRSALLELSLSKQLSEEAQPCKYGITGGIDGFNTIFDYMKRYEAMGLYFYSSSAEMNNCYNYQDLFCHASQYSLFNYEICCIVNKTIIQVTVAKADTSKPVVH